MNYQADLDLALELADIADAISLERFRALDLHVENKPDRSPVTDADRSVEQAIKRMLAEKAPNDALIGEEYGNTGTSSRTWIIDPIDGTANYLRGVPVWATLIALAIDGKSVVSEFRPRPWVAAGGQRLTQVPLPKTSMAALAN